MKIKLKDKNLDRYYLIKDIFSLYNMLDMVVCDIYDDSKYPKNNMIDMKSLVANTILVNKFPWE